MTGGANGDGSAIRVLLIDDHTMFRETLSSMIRDSDGLDVVGHAGDGREGLALAHELQPDVVIVDYKMPEFDGMQVTERLSDEAPDIRIVILTMYDNVHYVLRTLHAGAHGFVVKSAAFDELVAAVRAVHAGDEYLSPPISRKLAQYHRTARLDKSGVDSLSAREFQLLQLLGQGMALQACARRMNVTDSTASTYRSRLMAKLGLDSTAAIIRYALENGIAS